MAGFLDKNTRVVDMHLTMEGKRLLSLGQLRFSYFALFDDEVDYDPFISQSGSMTAAQISGTRDDYIENTLVREAVSGYRLSNRSGSDNVNVQKPLFTMKQGAKYLPRMSGSLAPTGSITLQAYQQKYQDSYTRVDKNGTVIENLGPIDQGYNRFGSQVRQVAYDLTPSDVALDPAHQDGILIRVFKSGSEGLQEIKPRPNAANRLTYSNDLVFGVGQSADLTEGLKKE